MSTLQDVITNNSSLTRAQLKADKALVMEIQTKLSNLGFYPGGGWIDGDLGGVSSFSWKGLINFCRTVDIVTVPSDIVAINLDIAKKLLEALQVDFILEEAKIESTLEKLTKIQIASIIANPNTEAAAFVARTTSKSPFQKFINDYPTYLEQKPDGSSVTSYANSLTLSTGVNLYILVAIKLLKQGTEDHQV